MTRGNSLAALALILLVAGCPRLSENPARPLAPLPATSSDTRQDPLRMPPELHLRNVRQLSFGGRAFAPLFSRDGKRLAFLVVPPASREPDAGAPAPIAHVVDLPVGGTGGAELHRAADAQLTAGALADLWLSPTGDLCADVAATPCPPAPAVCRIDATRELGGGRCAPPRWPLSRAGPCAANAAGDWACLLIAAAGTQLWLWPAEAPAPHALDSRPGDDAEPLFSQNGKLLAWSSTRGEVAGQPGARAPSGIEILEATQFAAPAPPLAISPPGQANQHPTFFPDGIHLAFASNADDAAGRDMDVFRAGMEGRDLQRITFAAGADLDPAISPDGHWLAWVSERNAAAPGEQDVMIAEWVE